MSGTTLFAGTWGTSVWKYDLATSAETDTKPEPAATLSITAYPNPSTSTATITVSPEAAGGTLEVFNIYGAKVFSTSLTAGNSTIDVAGFAAGCIRWW